MRQQRNMSQMKEQDKTPEEQLSEVERVNLPEKELSNDSTDDTTSQKKNRGTNQENTKSKDL